MVLFRSSLAVGLMLATVACTQNTKDAGTTSATYQTRASEGAIAFQLTPRRANGRLAVEIQANTHSGDLSELKLDKMVTLRANDRTYRPVEASSLAGHHARGSVAFDLPESVDHFSITMSSVRGMPEQTFNWP